MKPGIGRIVIVKGAITSNGSNEHPAIINAVFDKNFDPANGDRGYVNTTVFPDCGTPTCITSVNLFETREAADAAMIAGVSPVAFWPDRV